MKQLTTILYLLTVFLLTSCSNSNDKELYGTYEQTDTLIIPYVKLNLYKGNIFSMSASSYISNNKDSGTFVLIKDTLYFTSLSKNKSDFDHPNMTDQKYLYRKDKIFYVKKGHLIADWHLTKVTSK